MRHGACIAGRCVAFPQKFWVAQCHSQVVQGTLVVCADFGPKYVLESNCGDDVCAIGLE